MGASKAEQAMLLLSFASHTSHFWQMGGVMQAKMRSPWRVLVKSNMETDRRMQPQLGKPITLPPYPAQNAKDTGTDRYVLL